MPDEPIDEVASDEDATPTTEATITPVDWSRSAEVFADCADPSVMDDAWR